MSRKGSRMAFVAGVIGRAVVTGLAMYGARKLYEDFQNAVRPGRNQPPEESIWTPDAEEAESESPNASTSKIPFPELFNSYYVEKVRVDSQRYEEQMVILGHCCDTVQTLLTQALPRLSFGKMEVKSHENLETVGKNNVHLVHLPIVLDANLWECVGGSDTILPNAEGFYLLKRINQQFFKQGSDPLDQFLVGSYLNSGKLFAHIRERCLLLDTERELRYRLEARVSQCIEFGIETENDRFSFTLQVAVNVNQSSVVATNVDESMWTKSFFEAENAALRDLKDEEIRTLQILLHCATSDEVLCELPLASLFTNIILSLSHDSRLKAKDAFHMVLKILANALKRGCLPQFFNPFVNILRFTKDRDGERISAYLDHLAEEGFEGLLKI